VTAKRELIAIDIDDVIADTNAAFWAWSNEVTGKALTREHFAIDADYWGYYEKIWEMNDIAHLKVDDFLDGLMADQSHMDILPGAQLGLQELAKQFDLVFVTSRNPNMEKATRSWLERHITDNFDLFFAKAGHHAYGAAASSKGEICKELGATLLIDDNVEHVQSALDNGVEAVLFGNYGWQRDIPEAAFRAEAWSDVLEYVNDRRKS